VIESGKIDRYWRTLAHLTVNGRDGRQYLVVVAGGHGSTNTKVGDAVIAYAPPKQAIRRMNRAMPQCVPSLAAHNF